MPSHWVRAGVRLAALAPVLASFACDSDVTEPAVISVSVSIDVPQPDAFPGAAVPEAVGSVALRVESPECGGALAHADTVDVIDSSEDVTFSFDLPASSTACFSVEAFSGAGATGTLVFEGTTADVDLTVGGSVNVVVDLSLVAVPPPVVSTLPPTGVSSGTATFEATVNPMGFETVAYFEFGTTDSYGSTTPVQTVGASRNDEPVSQLVTGLDPEQQYHYRVVAINSGNMVTGADQTVVTAEAANVTLEFPGLVPPTVTTEAADGVTGTSATLHGRVNPEGTDTWAYFEWGPDIGYGNTTPAQAVGQGTADVATEAALDGLALGTPYHFRVVAVNAGGLSLGADQQLTTSGCEPSGYDFPGNGVDEDCDGEVDNVLACDDGLAIDTEDPRHGAMAIGICREAADETDWGLVSAAWVQADGSAPPADATQLANFHLGHGILDTFGANVAVQEGARFLALATGTARAPDDPGYVSPGGDAASPGGFDKGYEGGFPEGFPVATPDCPTPGTPHDAAGLEITVRVPDNAAGFSFRFRYHTADFPNWVCESFNDQFVAMMSPFLGSATPGNVAFGPGGDPPNTNSPDFIVVCDPATAPEGYSCPAGSSPLLGTGYDERGASEWLATTVPADPGTEVTLRFAIYDSQDGLVDSLVLIDDFRWIP